MDVSGWVPHDAAHEFSESGLVRVGLAIHVFWVGCWKDSERGVGVPRITPDRILLDHEAADGAQFHHVLLDRL